MRDIIDVWFESGSTHAFVLEARGMPWPADLYLEGSDQHRGWFHSSLLEAVGTRGRAPFKAVLTHGFLVDEQGRKMSKSLGNGVEPQDVIAKLGADILRLWVMSSDARDDLGIGPEILKPAGRDLYRRLRNTLRWVLGSLDGFSEAEALPVADIARAGALGAASPVGTRRAAARRRSRATTGTASIPPSIISVRPISPPSTSTSARTRSIATGPTACGAAARARCSTSCIAA